MDVPAGAKYVPTASEAVTQADQARIIGEATGLPVTWEEASSEEIRGQLTAATGDRAFADHALAYRASLIGRPESAARSRSPAPSRRSPAPRPRTFRDWARDHVGDFRPRP